MDNDTIYITEIDRRRLLELIDVFRPGTQLNGNAPYIQALAAELQRATVVRPEEIPGDVITMNSTVSLRDLDLDSVETYTLVYPEHADPESNRISVIAPIGTAIIGCRVGDVIEWPVPAGVRTLEVEEVLYQPEREGVLDE